jgi:hypothetical protein
MGRYIALAAFFVVANPAQAGELVARGAESIELGSVHGITFYTEAQDGYRVITTLADGESGLPVRFEATLADRQSVTISVLGKLGEPSKVLKISRVGDKAIFSPPQTLEVDVVAVSPQAPRD